MAVKKQYWEHEKYEEPSKEISLHKKPCMNDGNTRKNGNVSKKKKV
jgi:hypothetical protein